jgi:hypothetical protein
MTKARNIIRELQALDARLERDGDRLVLRAGSRPVPQSLVHQARDAKQELLALLGDISGLSAPCQDGRSLTKVPMAVLGNNGTNRPGNANDSLRPPTGSLSDGLNGLTDTLALLGDAEIAANPELLCGYGGNHPTPNLQVPGSVAPEMPKNATPIAALAVLADGQASCGFRLRSWSKTAKPCCVGDLGYLAAQKYAVEPNPIKPAVLQPRAPPMCCECGLAITEEVSSWWSGEPVHHGCGEAAFEREKARGMYVRR